MDPTLRGRIPHIPSRRPQSRFRLNRRTLFIVGGIMLTGMIGVILLANSGDKSVTLQRHLVARLATLETMSADGNKNIVDEDLKALNARLKVQLTSDQTSISSLVTYGKNDKAIDAAEADTFSFETLENARLNNHYDSTYRRIISQKLDSTTALIKELYNVTRSEKLKQALDSSYASLNVLENQFTPTNAN